MVSPLARGSPDGFVAEGSSEVVDLLDGPSPWLASSWCAIQAMAWVNTWIVQSPC